MGVPWLIVKQWVLQVVVLLGDQRLSQNPKEKQSLCDLGVLT